MIILTMNKILTHTMKGALEIVSIKGDEEIKLNSFLVGAE